MARQTSRPTFFATPRAFRAWFEKHHHTHDELLVGFHKKGTGTPSITWPESVDQALCFGWIDGIRRRIDEERYSIRFTPRRLRSIWSAINIARAEELTKLEQMHSSGLKAFERRDEVRSRIYSYEQRHHAVLEPAHQKLLQSNKKAWAFFQQQPPSYRRVTIYWVVSAKQDATKLKRLSKLIETSAKAKRL